MKLALEHRDRKDTKLMLTWRQLFQVKDILFTSKTAKCSKQQVSFSTRDIPPSTTVLANIISREKLLSPNGATLTSPTVFSSTHLLMASETLLFETNSLFTKIYHKN
jgi:hypothetical protein